MSDLAERIRAAKARWADAQRKNNEQAQQDAWDDLADILDDNAPTILAGLAALEERDKLRAALLYARDVLFVLPSVIANNDEIDRRINKGIAMIDAALQPTPEQTKEK